MNSLGKHSHVSDKRFSNVYFTKDISSEGLIYVYKALNKEPKSSDKVAVKISSGEPGGHHFLSPDLIKDLVKMVHGTIVECNTAYEGKRMKTESHKQVMKDHGYSAIAPIDIMDENGSLELLIPNGLHLDKNYVGSHLSNYSYIINLAHFKGHAMAGFGGVLKNQSIGIASAKGKSYIHSAGKEFSGLGIGVNQNDFLESMAEAAKSVSDFLKGNILYIDVMNNLSVDCDCNKHPAKPTMNDIGILASLDPVALDQACIDLVYASKDGKDLIERIETKNGVHILEHAYDIGLGTRNYELFSIDSGTNDDF